MVARACSLRVRPYWSARVAPTRSAAIGTAVQRFLEARRKRLAQNHHSGGQPLRAAGHWRDHSGQSDHRDGLCDPCRLHATRPGQAPCSANHQPRACPARRICHQQAFAGPQHLVGWRRFDVCGVISSRPTWCVSVDTWGHPQREQKITGGPLNSGLRTRTSHRTTSTPAPRTRRRPALRGTTPVAVRLRVGAPVDTGVSASRWQLARIDG